MDLSVAVTGRFMYDRFARWHAKALTLLFLSVFLVCYKVPHCLLMFCFIISNPISLATHEKLLLQAVCQSSLFPSLCCMTQLIYDVHVYFNVIFVTVHMPKDFSRSHILISWKKYMFKTSVFEKRENSFSSFLLFAGQG